MHRALQYLVTAPVYLLAIPVATSCSMTVKTGSVVSLSTRKHHKECNSPQVELIMICLT